MVSRDQERSLYALVGDVLARAGAQSEAFDYRLKYLASYNDEATAEARAPARAAAIAACTAAIGLESMFQMDHLLDLAVRTA